jgi:hypothetical protein
VPRADTVPDPEASCFHIEVTSVAGAIAELETGPAEQHGVRDSADHRVRAVRVSADEACLDLAAVPAKQTAAGLAPGLVRAATPGSLAD